MNCRFLEFSEIIRIIARFFGNVYKYKNLYVTKTAEDAQRQLKLLVKHTKIMTIAFAEDRGTRILADTPIQLRLEVTVPATKDSPVLEIPQSATVTGTYATFDLFGLMPPMENRQLPSTTWVRVKEAVTPAHKGTPLWFLYLERDMLKVINQQTPGRSSTSLLSKDSVYRPRAC
jgi:hypothetical protein